MPTDQEPTKLRILPRLNNPDRTGGEAVTLENIIGQAIGAASVCWENMTGAGVFDSARARQILDEVMEAISETTNQRTEHTSDDCPFCSRIKAGQYADEDHEIVSFPPLNPVTEGHRLFLPIKHVVDAAHSPVLTGRAFEAAARHGEYATDAFNLITSAGTDATQTVPHLHVHYVPRRAGDGLTLPWTGQAKLADQQPEGAW